MKINMSTRRQNWQLATTRYHAGADKICDGRSNPESQKTAEITPNPKRQNGVKSLYSTKHVLENVNHAIELTASDKKPPSADEISATENRLKYCCPKNRLLYGVKKLPSLGGLIQTNLWFVMVCHYSTGSSCETKKRLSAVDPLVWFLLVESKERRSK